MYRSYELALPAFHRRIGYHSSRFDRVAIRTPVVTPFPIDLANRHLLVAMPYHVRWGLRAGLFNYNGSADRLAPQKIKTLCGQRKIARLAFDFCD